MKSLPELQSFYQDTLKPKLDVLEADRLAVVKKIYYWCVPASVLGVFFVVLLMSNSAVQEGLFAGLVTVAVCVLVVGVQSRGYVSDFKETIIKDLVTFLDPALQYRPTMFIDQAQFLRCGIFRMQPNRYRGDDLVAGTIGSTRIEFSELHAEHVTRDSKGREYHHRIFKGLFFIADFNKNFKGQTYVLTDSTEGMGVIGHWLQSMGGSHGELVKLEDPEFEKMFVVYSDDQIEARYILSTSLMARIVAFARKSGRRIQLSFVGSKVYIAVPYDRNLFEPHVFETILNFAPIQQYFEDLELAVGIVEDLNLNLRIWTKS